MLPRDAVAESDSKLVCECLNGSAPAWEALVARYARLVYSIPYRRGLTPMDCDEVFQGVFLIVYRKLDTLRDKHMLAPWLIAITNNETILRLRMQKASDQVSELTEEIVGADDSPHEMVERLEKQYIVRAALNLLGEPCRSLLTLLFLNPDTISYRDLADRLGIPVGSIGPSRQRCFAKLVRVLESDFGFRV